MAVGPVWNGTQIETVGDLFSAVSQLKDRDEGQRFMREYIAYLKAEDVPDAESTAFSNVGYVAGYGTQDTLNRVREMTGAQHPILG